MVTFVVPSELEDEIVSTPAIVENCLMSGVATDVAIISGEAPGISADTLMVGNSARGKAATGNSFQAKRPPSKIATESKMVATGRLMQKAEMFMAERLQLQTGLSSGPFWWWCHRQVQPVLRLNW